MLTRVGPGNSGYNYLPEYMDFDCTMHLAANATLEQGQALFRDVTAVPSSAGADTVVLPNDAKAGSTFGVYQGPAIVNPHGDGPLKVALQVRRYGFGVVTVHAPAKEVRVGSHLAKGAGIQAVALDPVDAFVKGQHIGTAVTTGAHNAVGDVLLALDGPAKVVNCLIDCS
jgi:hypothetical protein